MATIIKEIEVDVSQLKRFAAIVAKQYDKQSRFLKVTLLDSGERIKVESASTAVINARREDEVAKTFEGTDNSKYQGEYLLESVIEAYTNSGTQFQSNTILNFAKLPGSESKTTPGKIESSNNKDSAGTITVGGMKIDIPILH